MAEISPGRRRLYGTIAALLVVLGISTALSTVLLVVPAARDATDVFLRWAAPAAARYSDARAELRDADGRRQELCDSQTALRRSALEGARPRWRAAREAARGELCTQAEELSDDLVTLERQVEATRARGQGAERALRSAVREVQDLGSEISAAEGRRGILARDLAELDFCRAWYTARGRVLFGSPRRACEGLEGLRRDFQATQAAIAAKGAHRGASERAAREARDLAEGAREALGEALAAAREAREAYGKIDRACREAMEPRKPEIDELDAHLSEAERTELAEAEERCRAAKARVAEVGERVLATQEIADQAAAARSRVARLALFLLALGGWSAFLRLAARFALLGEHVRPLRWSRRPPE